MVKSATKLVQEQHHSDSFDIGFATDVPSVDGERVREAREYLEAAAIILRSMGPDYTRISWLVEDTVSHLAMVEQETVSSGALLADSSIPSSLLSPQLLAELDELANQ